MLGLDISSGSSQLKILSNQVFTSLARLLYLFNLDPRSQLCPFPCTFLSTIMCHNGNCDGDNSQTCSTEQTWCTTQFRQNIHTRKNNLVKTASVLEYAGISERWPARLAYLVRGTRETLPTIALWPPSAFAHIQVHPTCTHSHTIGYQLPMKDTVPMHQQHGWILKHQEKGEE